MGKVKEPLQNDLEIASVAKKGETDSSKTRAPKRRSLVILVLTLACLFIIIGVSWAILASRPDSRSSKANNGSLSTDKNPSLAPTMLPPTENPIADPTSVPTSPPSLYPSRVPFQPISPTEKPVINPTNSPTVMPSQAPFPGVTPNPTPMPTLLPTPMPTPFPTPMPTPLPTPMPTPFPTPMPFPDPTNSPTSAPSAPSLPSYITISFDTERIPGTSGIYFPSIDLIGDRNVWYRQGDDGSDSMMIYFCSSFDQWVLTSAFWRQELIEANGGGCGGYEFTISGSGSSNGWWTYDWNSIVTISFDPPPTQSPTASLPNSVTITFINEYIGGSSGKYFTSNDDIGAKPVWYRDGDTGDDSMMIFYCESGDYWVLTSAYYRQGLINSNGGGCGGFEWTYSGGTFFDSWWAREWTTETKISFDDTDFLDLSIDEIFDILEDPTLYSPDVLGRAE